MSPKVLVLLAAFNGSRWISEQLQSILRQVHVDVEILVSDDGSTDDTKALAIDSGDSRVRVTSPPIPTGSAAQNFLWLIRNTPADPYDFVALSDQDDIRHPEKLVKACTMLVEQDAAGYSCAVTAFWASGREMVLRQSSRVTESDFLFEGAGQGCTFVVTRDLYRRLRAFYVRNTAHSSQLHYHDWSIYALSRVWNYRWTFDRQPMMKYRQHDANDTGARASLSGIARRLGLIRQGWYAKQLTVIAQLCAQADSSDARISRWNTLLSLPIGLPRRFRILVFCLRGARRRWSDKAMLLVAVVAGWI
jgi:rhamnosyltransferase